MTNTYNRDLHTHTIKEYDVQQSSKSVKGFTFGFTLGVTIGSLIGLALAPKPGRELQKDINDKVVSLKSDAENKGNTKVDQLKDKAVEIKEIALEKAEQVKAKADQIKEQVTEKTEEVKQQVADKTEEVKDKATEVKDQAAKKTEEVKQQAAAKVEEVKDKTKENKKEATADELAAQHRAIKEEVNDETLKEPIAIVDKELENSKKTKNNKKNGK